MGNRSGEEVGKTSLGSRMLTDACAWALRRPVEVSTACECFFFLDFVPVGLGSPASPGADKDLSSCLVSQSGWYGGVREVVLPGTWAMNCSCCCLGCESGRPRGLFLLSPALEIYPSRERARGQGPCSASTEHLYRKQNRAGLSAPALHILG